MNHREIRSIEQRTVNLLLSNVKSVEDVKMAQQAVVDYHQDSGMKTGNYRMDIYDLKISL